MDLKISGSAKAGGGEYENVRLSGSSQIDGRVHCKSYHASGASNCGELDCDGEVHISGASKFKGDVKCASFTGSGASKVCGSLTCAGEAVMSGATNVGGDVKCGVLRASGASNVGGGIEGETVRVSGALKCGGLINAEEVDISFCDNSEAESVGGTTINIYRSKLSGNVLRIFGITIGSGTHSHGKFTVRGDIEGDKVTLEHVTANCVCGREVVIGEGCKIGTVRYSGTFEAADDAEVGSVERV